MTESTDGEQSGKLKIVEPPAKFKSEIRTHFGFVEKKNDCGENMTDMLMSVCRHCETAIVYKLGNTSNMRSHLMNHHLEKILDVKPRSKRGQTTIREAFQPGFPHDSTRAQLI